MFLAVLSSAFQEEILEGGASRIVLKIPPVLAPVQVAVLPLTKKDGLPDKARQIMDQLKLDYDCNYDEKDSIGKRYRRQDAIGTPYCITIDHQSLEDDSITVRHRDTMEQERINLEDLEKEMASKLQIKHVLNQL